MSDNQKKRGPGRPKGSKNKKSSEVNVPAVAKSKEAQVREIQNKSKNSSRLNDAIWSVAIFAVGCFLFFTIITDSTGAMGALIHDMFMGLFAVMAYVLPFYFIAYALLLFFKKLQHIGTRTAVCSVVLFVDMCLINSYRFIEQNKLAFGFNDIKKYYIAGVSGDKGGAVGMEIGSLLVKLLGKSGMMILCIAILVICILLLVNNPLSIAYEKYKEKKEAKLILEQLSETEAEMGGASAEAKAKADTGLFGGILPWNQSTQAGRGSDSDRKTSAAIPSVMPSATFDREDSASSVKNTGLPDVTDDNSKVSYGLESSGKTRTGFGLGDYVEPERSNVRFESDVNPASFASASHSTNHSEKGQVIPDNSDINNVPEKEEVSVNMPVIETSVSETAVDNEPESPKPRRRTKVKAEDAADDGDDSLEKDLESSINSSQAHHEFYRLPDISLLKRPKVQGSMLSENQLRVKAATLEQVLRDFGVDATVIKVTQGASVTRYEVQPATGVKVSKITALADDIALNMRAKSIRMEAPIPGKAAVGIEIENDKAAPVLIRELIDSEEFRASESKLTFVVGKDISGRNIVADLKGMPHMLIAGATGSGKSVCINTIIASILYKANPYEVKFIMIDPKVVELGNYNGIPHMSIPVVTDPKKAARALNWAVGEMNKRYEEFAKVRVKDLETYNRYARENHMEVKPQIVIIIDELADLMMAAPSQVEESICRLAQKARAAGMNLIVATQRPSVDIVTGVIKANIPSRIAFSVSSQFDSRTILDMSGAEKLLGKGDMLFYPVGANKPLRVQGPFITDKETQDIIEFAKNQGDPDYNEELENDINSESEQKGGSQASDGDELTEDAIEFILKSKQASVSMLQRRFRIGYNRAARIIDEIEEKGIIGPSDGSRPRQVLVTEEEYYGGHQETADYDEAEDESDDETDNKSLE